MRQRMMLGALAAGALTVSVLGSGATQAQTIYDSEGSYSGRYTRDYKIDRRDRYNGRYAYYRGYGWDRGWRAPYYRNRFSRGCYDDAGGGRYYRC